MKTFLTVAVLLCLSAFAQDDLRGHGQPWPEMEHAVAELAAELAQAKAEAVDGGFRLCTDGESGAGCSQRPCVSGLSFDGGFRDDCGNNINTSTLVPPVDAPVADPPIANLPPKGRVLELGAGDLLPFDATCLDKQQARRDGKVSKYYRTEAEELKRGNVILSTPIFITIVAGVAVAAAAAAVSIYVAIEPHPPPTR